MFKKVNGHLMLSDAFYAFAKKVVQIFLPAFSTFYFAMGPVWGLPGVEKVVGTIAAVTTFLGVTLHLSSKSFDNSGAALMALDQAQQENSKGEMIVQKDPETGRKLFSLSLDETLEDLESKGAISFKVVHKD